MPPDASDQLISHLTACEHGMWDPTKRYDHGWMARHLHDDFVEFGRSGRRYDRSNIMDGEPRSLEATLEALRVDPVADDVAITTYRSTLRVEGHPDEHANRSSVWVRVDGNWRLRFHQGTPVDGPSDRR